MSSSSEGSDLSDRIGQMDPLTPATIAAAQRTVAAYLGEPAATAEVLDMLGIGAPT